MPPGHRFAALGKNPEYRSPRPLGESGNFLRTLWSIQDLGIVTWRYLRWLAAATTIQTDPLPNRELRQF
jgi:hypothetical protein